MAKQTKTPKYLIVRSKNERRNRAGFEFTSQNQLIDVKGEDLSEEQIDQIKSDPGLMVIESSSKPDSDTPEVHRAYGADGRPVQVQPTVQTERATPEQLEAQEKGEPIPPHPQQAPATPTGAATTAAPQPPEPPKESSKGDKKTSK